MDARPDRQQLELNQEMPMHCFHNMKVDDETTGQGPGYSNLHLLHKSTPISQISNYYSSLHLLLKPTSKLQV